MSDENEWELYELEATISKLKAELATARDEVEELTEQNRLACLCAVKTGLFDVANRDYPDQMDIAKALVDARAEAEELRKDKAYLQDKLKEQVIFNNDVRKGQNDE